MANDGFAQGTTAKENIEQILDALPLPAYVIDVDRHVLHENLALIEWENKHQVFDETVSSAESPSNIASTAAPSSTSKQQSELPTCYRILRAGDAPCKECPISMLGPGCTTATSGVTVRGNRNVVTTATPTEWRGRSAYLVTFQDITEFTEMQEQLKRAEQNYRDVSAFTNSGLMIIQKIDDKLLNPLFISDGLYTLLGMEPIREPLPIGTYDNSLTSVYPADKSIAISHLAQLNNNGDEAETMYRLLRADGSYIWVRARGRVVEENGTNLIYVSYNDATHEVEARDAEAFQHRVTQEAISQSGLNFYEYDTDTHSAKMDERGQQWYGFKETYNDFPEDLFADGAIHPEDQHISREAFDRLNNGSLHEEFDVRIRPRPDAPWIWVRSFCSAIVTTGDSTDMRIRSRDGSSNHAARVVCSVQNVHELKDLENSFFAVMKQTGTMVWRYEIGASIVLPATGEGFRANTPLREQASGASKVNGDSVIKMLVHPDDLAVSQRMRERLDNGAGSVSENVRVMRNGDYVWHRVTVTELPSGGSQRRDAIGSAVDISAEMRARDEFDNATISQSGEGNGALLSKARVNFSKNKIFDFVVSPISVFYGHEPVEASYDDVMRNVWEEHTVLKAGGDRYRLSDFLASEVVKHYRDEECRRMSMTYLRMFKREVLWTRNELIVYENRTTGDIEGYFYFTNVDQEQKRELALTRLSKIVCDGIRVIDVLTQISSPRMDEAATKSEAMPHDDVVRNLICPQADDPDDAFGQLRLASVKQALRTNPQYVVTINQGKSTPPRWKRFTFVYLDASHTSILTIRTDVTDAVAQVKQQQQLTQALDEAQVASKAKSEFLSTMSHDIRTPMNAIVNLTRMMRDEADDKKALEEDLARIDSSAHFLLGLINDILDMSRIESGRLEFNPTVYWRSDFIEYINSIVRPLADDKGIEFICEKPAGDRAIIVDRTRFNQVFFNLLSNAVKFTAAGGRVQLLIEPGVECGGMLPCDYTVTDTGIGMSKEFQARMFESFEREHSASEYEGTGLGLSIVKAIVDKSGGTLSVKSEVGKGSKFHVHLDLLLATPEQMAETPKDSECSVGGPVPGKSLDSKHVLLCEDNAMNVIIAQRVLQKRGIVVDCAINGEEGLKKFEASEPNYYDAILMDVRMPVMNGLQATRAIRALDRPDAENVPIIAMTADAFAEDKQRTREAGMNAHLSKPIQPEALYDVLAREMVSGR